MTEALKTALQIMREQVDVEDPPGDWFLVTQERIDMFADVTSDHNYIHCDPERCREESPFEVPIAHGFSTLSLIPHLIDSIPEPSPSPFQDLVLKVNYGLNRVRFVSPVPVNSRIRARRKLLAAQKKGRVAIDATYAVTVEVEGREKPACLAEWILRAVYDGDLKP